MKKLEVGQKVFVITQGNAARHGVKTFEAEVISVGRSLFELKAEGRAMRNKFRFDNMQENTDFSSDYTVFNSEFDYKETQGKPILVRETANLLHELSSSQIEEVKIFINSLKK